MLGSWQSQSDAAVASLRTTSTASQILPTDGASRNRSAYQAAYRSSRASAAVEKDSDRTLTRARKIGELKRSRLFKNSLGKDDFDDYYRFTLSQTQDLQLSLKGLKTNADVQLLNQAGKVLAESRNAKTRAETIHSTLQSGTYYVRVSTTATRKTRYTLALDTRTIPTTKWTVLVYMAGDSLENFGIQDFREMAQIGSTDTVNVVAQFDRTDGYGRTYGNWTDTRRGSIRQGDSPGLNWGTSVGEVNMGDANTLKNFLTWGMNTYRAENYAVVMWGHGTGFQVSYDDITGDSISAKELGTTLSSLPDSVDLVGTDACLMGTTEFAYELRNSASVFVGSQELEPSPGWNYTSVLQALNSNPTMNAFQFGSTIVDRYRQHYSTPANNQSSIAETLSAINLTSLRDTAANSLTTAINGFAAAVISTASESDLSRIDSYRDRYSGRFAQNEYPDYPNYCDLGNLFSGLASDTQLSGGLRSAAQTVLTAYSGAVINNYSEQAGKGTGLSLYISDRGSRPESFYNAQTFGFAANTQWDDLLNWLWW